jgi:hypothetical protein
MMFHIVETDEEEREEESKKSQTNLFDKSRNLKKCGLRPLVNIFELWVPHLRLKSKFSFFPFPPFATMATQSTVVDNVLDAIHQQLSSFQKPTSFLHEHAHHTLQFFQAVRRTTKGWTNA